MATADAAPIPVSPVVSVFAPEVLLTVTVEGGTGDGGPEPEIHLHAGGQGFWVARLVASLGIPVELCAPVGGEAGRLLQVLVPEAGIGFRPVVGDAWSGSYVHDRRSGDRREVARARSQPLRRHHLDDLYGAALTSGLAADVTVVTGAAEPGPIPHDLFGRLVGDLAANGRTTVCDLSGPQLAAAVEAGVAVAKVSDRELLDGGWAADLDTRALVDGARCLQEKGAEAVVVSRAAEPALVVGDEVHRIHAPSVEASDHRGGGDSMTAGIAAGLATGRDLQRSAVLGVAAGVLNASRRGLGSGRLQDVLDFSAFVTVEPWGGGGRCVLGPW
jgi:1-phosphofructokinase